MSESRSESSVENDWAFGLRPGRRPSGAEGTKACESDYENDGETSLFGQSLHDWAVELRLARCHIGSYNDEQTRFLPSRLTPNVVT